MTTSSTPEPSTTTTPVTIDLAEDASVDAVWSRLCAGLDAPWLDEIRDLHTGEDDIEASLDIWSVALAAALKQPERRATASAILTRLAHMPEAPDADEV